MNGLAPDSDIGFNTVIERSVWRRRPAPAFIDRPDIFHAIDEEADAVIVRTDNQDMPIQRINLLIGIEAKEAARIDNRDHFAAEIQEAFDAGRHARRQRQVR